MLSVVVSTLLLLSAAPGAGAAADAATAVAARDDSRAKPLSRATVFTDLFASAASRFDLRFDSRPHPTAAAPAAEGVSTVDILLGPSRYSCAIPPAFDDLAPRQGDPALSEPASPDDEDDRDVEPAEAQRRTFRHNAWKGMELLKGMEPHCLYYISGWWTYEYCHNRHIRQFHPQPPQEAAKHPEKKQDYFLGRLPTGNDVSPVAFAEYTPTESTNGRLSIQYNDGTVCAVAQNAPRRTTVQFHCSPGSMDTIVSVVETASCVYTVDIATSRLCNDDAFVAPTEAKGETAIIWCRQLSESANNDDRDEDLPPAGGGHDAGLLDGKDGGGLRTRHLGRGAQTGKFAIENMYPHLVSVTHAGNLAVLPRQPGIVTDGGKLAQVKSILSGLGTMGNHDAAAGINIAQLLNNIKLAPTNNHNSKDNENNEKNGNNNVDKRGTQNNNEHANIKFVELVIDGDGNVVVDEKAETFLKEFFAAAAGTSGKSAGDDDSSTQQETETTQTSTHANAISRHTVEHDGVIVEDTVSGASVSTESKDGVASSVEVVMLDGGDVPPEAMEKLKRLFALMDSAGATVKSADGDGNKEAAIEGDEEDQADAD
ncbi:Protein OS-9 [Entophlyctis luteolus]|nr:Protein OS-9 [Entophlyctis luteolus]